MKNQKLKNIHDQVNFMQKKSKINKFTETLKTKIKKNKKKTVNFEIPHKNKI